MIYSYFPKSNTSLKPIWKLNGKIILDDDDQHFKLGEDDDNEYGDNE